MGECRHADSRSGDWRRDGDCRHEAAAAAAEESGGGDELESLRPVRWWLFVWVLGHFNRGKEKLWSGWDFAGTGDDISYLSTHNRLCG